MGQRAVPHALHFVAFLGATTELELVWTFSDLANGLMALPNLVGLLILSGLVARETSEYLKFDPKLKKDPDEVARFVQQQGMNWQ